MNDAFTSEVAPVASNGVQTATYDQKVSHPVRVKGYKNQTSIIIDYVIFFNKELLSITT